MKTAPALIVVAAALGLALRSRPGRIQWSTADGPLALPALHPADRALVRAAEAVIDAA